MYNSLVKDVDQGKTSEDQYIVKNIVLFIPYIAGLSLSSCLLNCIVDSVDEIRDFRDRYIDCWPSLISCLRRFRGDKTSTYDVTEEQNNTHEITWETSHLHLHGQTGTKGCLRDKQRKTRVSTI